MKLANVDGRAVLISTDITDTSTGVTHGIDVAEASAGEFGPACRLCTRTGIDS